MRRALIGAGAVLMGYALISAILDAEVNKVGVLIFLAGVLVLHDGVFLPLVIAAGALSRVRATGVITLAVLVVGLPLALGFGRPADNPSALPLAYARNLLLILVLIWVPVTVRAIRKAMERRRTRALCASGG